jgi:tetratricopeptide (TPR) repeat protein
MKLIPADADICVCVDLDELFEPGWAQNLRDHWKPDTEKMKYLYTWDHDETGKPKTQIWYEKIHDNSGNWYWAMPVHEALTFKLDRKPVTHFMPEDKFHLHHYPDLTKSRGQYLDLMKMAIDENPNDYMQNYYYGRELTYKRRWQEAATQLEKVTKMPTNLRPNQAAAYGFLAKSYEALGMDEEAELAFIKATQYVIGVREPFVNLTAFYYRKQRWYSLIDIGLRSLEIKQIKTEWYENSENYRQLPHDYLSIAFYNIGDFEKAHEHIKLALSFKPEDTRLQNNLKLIENKM